jgi:hypothetical protein
MSARCYGKAHALSVLGLTQTEYEELVNAIGPRSLNEFISIMEKRITRERIPEVVRRTGDRWLNDRSLLEVLRTEGMETIKAYLDRLFSYLPE